MKKVIILCDNCKHSYDNNTDFIKLTFKKPGKKSGNNYEVCPSCSEKIQSQLVGNKELPPDWTFLKTKIEYSEPMPIPLDDDAHFVEKRLEAFKEADIPELVVKANEPSTISKKCIHANRTSPRLKSDAKGNKIFVMQCKDCNQSIPIRNLDEKKQFNNVSTKEFGGEIRMRDI